MFIKAVASIHKIVFSVPLNGKITVVWHGSVGKITLARHSEDDMENSEFT